MSGFYYPNDTFVPVHHRGCIRLPYVQSVLQVACRGRRNRVRCHCGGGFLEIFSLPFSAAKSLRRESIKDPHTTGCFASKLWAERPNSAVDYAATAFAEPTQAGELGIVVNCNQAGTGRRNGSCTHFAHQLFADASMRALRDANAGADYRSQQLKPFTAQDLHHAVRSELQNAFLSQGEPFLSGLAAQGLQVCWSVTTADMGQSLADAGAADTDAEIFLGQIHGATEGPPKSALLRIPRIVVRCAGGRRAGVGGILPPPYFVFFVGNQTSPGHITATRLVLFPVAAPDALFSIQSKFEREAVASWYHRGFVFLKPGVHYYLAKLGDSFWPFGLKETGRLPHLPDVLLYWRSQCWIVELAGRDNDQEYLKEVGERLAAMVAVARHPDVKPQRVLPREFQAKLRVAKLQAASKLR